MTARGKTLWMLMLIIAFQMISGLLTAETIFNETMGAAATITEINAYTGWSSNGSVYCSGTADVRSTYNSSGDYTGASGGGNVYFVGGMNDNFQISGINTRGYENIRLSLALYKANSNTSTGNAENGSNFLIRYSVDNGQSWRRIPIVIPTGTGTMETYYWREFGENIPATDNLTLSFSNIGATEPVHFRMDDVTVTGTTNCFFNESLGAGAANTTIESFSNWTSNSQGLFSGTGFVRNDLPSTGKYPGASGGGNIMLDAGQYFQVSGLNLTAYNMIALSVGVMKSSAAETGSGLLMSYSIDGFTWSSAQPCLTYGLTANLWYKKSFSLPPGLYTNVGIKFSNASTNGGSFRIDDLCLKHALNTPEIGFPSCVEQNSSMATLKASIVSLNCSNIIQRGFFYSTQNDFADGNGTMLYESVNMTQADDYIMDINGLQANTTYYFKAFATNSVGISYSGQQSFTTLATGVLPATLTVNPYGMGINNYLSLQEVVNALNSGTLATGGVTIKVAAGITEQITAPIIISATGTSTKPIVIVKDPATSGANPVIRRIDAGSIATSVEGGLGDCIIKIDGSDYLTIDGIDLCADDSGIEYGYLSSKPNATNGCQYLTIKNCSVTMNQIGNPYVAGIYIGNGTNSVSDATGVTVTAASGKNMNVAIKGNSIANVYSGILLRGSSASSYWDSDFTIGSSGAGNQVLNFGGNSLIPAKGIKFVNVTNPSVEYNVIDNSGAPHPAELTGISLASVKGVVNVNSNNITLACDTEEALINVIWIDNPSTATSESYANNTFSAGILKSMEVCILINAKNQTLTRTVTGNVSSGTFSLTGYPTTFYGYLGFTQETANTVYTISNNNFSNVIADNNSVITGIHSYLWGASSNLQISGNTVSNFLSANGEIAGIAIASSGTCNVSNNSVTSLCGSALLYGVRYYGNMINVNNNTISGLTNPSTTAGNAIRGIYQEYATNASCYNNVIYGLSSAKQECWVSGIEIEDGTTTKIYNNMIHSIYAAGSMGFTVMGLFIKEGVNTEISYNSIYIDGTGSSALYSSAALNLWGSTATLRNNIFVNKSTPGSYGTVMAYCKGSNANQDLGSSTNKNIYYAGIPDSQHLIASLGGTNYPTLAGYKAAVSTVDQGSFTQDVPFISTSGTYNLHINPTIPTYAQNLASPVSGITTDIDGQTRGTSIPDIGADEGSFTAAPTCAAPSAQATALVLSPASTSIGGTFSPSTAQAYLVLQHSAATASAAPVNGIDYALGASLGNATVISLGSATSFMATGLTPQTQYYFTVYAYNSFGISAPMYRTASPLRLGIQTLSAPPENPIEIAAFVASHSSIELQVTPNPAGSNVLIAWATSQTFGTPIGMYSVGSAISGGGTVLYMGPASGIPQHTGLSMWTTYYYTAWSYETVDRTVYGNYSSGITASIRTPKSPLLGVKTVNPMGSGADNYLSLSQAISDLNDSWTGPGGVIFNVVAGYTETITAPLTITATGFADSPITIQKDPSTSGANPVVIRNDEGIYGPNWPGALGDSIIRIEGSDYITFDGIDINSGNSGIDFGYLTYKPSGTNGCQYVTIKNCTIIMSKLTTNSHLGKVMGIYIGNGQKLYLSEGVTVTALSGINRNITITGNTVKNTNYGIFAKGSSLSGFLDTDFIIGTENSPNIIHDYSGFFCSGIDVRYLDNSSICYNVIDNAAGGGAPCESGIFGIDIQNFAGNIEVNFNNITLSTTPASSYVKWICLGGGETDNESIIGNTFAAGELSFTADSALIETYSVAQSRVIAQNATTGDIYAPVSTGNLYGFRSYFERRSVSENISNNHFTNLFVSGASKLYGIYTAGTTQPSTYSGNEIGNLSSNTGAISAMEIYGNSAILVANNTISNAGTAGNIYGIKTQGNSAEVRNNMVSDFHALGANAIVRGISVNVIGSTVYNNIVHSLFAYGPESGTSTPTIAGIETYYGAKIYHNTVHLLGGGFGAGLSSAAMYDPAGESYCRNNILINKTTPGSSGYSAARWGSTYAIGAGTNNNIYYAGTPSPRNVIVYINGITYQTLAQYKQVYTSVDALSFTEDVPFMNTWEFIDLHINPDIPTFAESGAVYIEGYSTDFDGDTRHATNPDIGADEGDFIRDGVPPNLATEPSPADLAVEQFTDIQLSWSIEAGGAIPTSYDVYFGTTNPPPLLVNWPYTEINLETLDYNQTYYWKIDPSNSYGLASSVNTLPVWSFTTECEPILSLDAPANLTVTMQDFNINLAWDAVTGAASYLVYSSDSPDPEDWGLPIAITDITSFSQEAILTKCFYRVTASSAAIIRTIPADTTEANPPYIKPRK